MKAFLHKSIDVNVKEGFIVGIKTKEALLLLHLFTIEISLESFEFVRKCLPFGIEIIATVTKKFKEYLVLMDNRDNTSKKEMNLVKDDGTILKVQTVDLRNFFVDYKIFLLDVRFTKNENVENYGIFKSNQILKGEEEIESFFKDDRYDFLATNSTPKDFSKLVRLDCVGSIAGTHKFFYSKNIKIAILLEDVRRITVKAHVVYHTELLIPFYCDTFDEAQDICKDLGIRKLRCLREMELEDWQHQIPMFNPERYIIDRGIKVEGFFRYYHYLIDGINDKVFVIF